MILGVELGEALSLINFFWMPFIPREFAKCSPGKAQDRRIVWSHPAFANKAMVVRNDKEMIRVALGVE